MLAMLSKNNVHIADVFFNFYHPKNPTLYPEHKNLRKPKPNMILKAAKKHNIDLENSFLIGDNESDIEAGKTAGLKYSFLLQTARNKTKKYQTIHESFTSMPSIVECIIKNDSN